MVFLVAVEHCQTSDMHLADSPLYPSKMIERDPDLTFKKFALLLMKKATLSSTFLSILPILLVLLPHLNSNSRLLLQLFHFLLVRLSWFSNIVSLISRLPRALKIPHAS